MDRRVPIRGILLFFTLVLAFGAGTRDSIEAIWHTVAPGRCTMQFTSSESILINRSPAAVFAALEDPVVQVTYDGEMYRSTEKLTAGPIGVGTRFRGDFKGMGKVEYEYAAFERDRLIEHLVRMPAGMVREPSLLGRVLWPIAMKRMMAKRIHTLNGLVKAYVESRSFQLFELYPERHGAAQEGVGT